MCQTIEKWHNNIRSGGNRSRSELSSSRGKAKTKAGFFSLPLADRKAALEAVMKTLGPGFVAEFNKHKSSQASTPGVSGSGKSAPCHGAAGKVPGNGKKTPKTSTAVKAVKKDAVPLPAPGSSPQSDELPQEKEVEEEEEDSPAGPSRPRAAPYNRVIIDVLCHSW